MAVTAKIILSSKQQFIGSTTLEFLPDYGDGKNKEWASSTPSLNLMMTVKPDVAELFPVGGSFTLTFEPEPAVAAGA